MKSKTNVILLVVFLAGLIGLWLADYARIPTAEQQRRLSGKVLPELQDVRPDTIRRVEVASGDDRRVFERRKDGGWQMVAPVNALASRTRVDALVANLKELPRASEGSSIGGDAARFGLDAPAHVVRVYGDDAKKPLAALEIGKTAEDHRYVRETGRPAVDLVESRFLAMLDTPAADWRERSLFTLATFDAASFAISGEGRDLKAHRDDAGWHLTRPIRAPGDEPKVEGVLATLTSLQAFEGPEGFAENDARDLAKYGLDHPSLILQLGTESAPDTPQVVHVGKPLEKDPRRVYARRADQDDVMVVSAEGLATIPKDPHALRSRSLAHLQPNRVDFLRITAGGQAHVLARRQEGWSVVTPVPGKADRRAVEELITKLGGLQASDFLDASQQRDTGLDAPSFRIEVWQDGLSGVGEARAKEANFRPQVPPVLDLSVGRETATKAYLYARETGDPAVLTLPKEAADLLPEGPLAFRDRVLQNIDGNRITGLTIVRDGKKVVLSGPGGELGKWRMTEPIGGPADTETVARMMVLISRLRAETLVRDVPGDLKPYGLDAPSMKISWTLRPDPARGKSEPGSAEEGATLSVGGPVPRHRGSRYAMLSDRPIVFTLAPQAMSILEAEPRDHRVVQFAMPQVARVVLQWPDRRLSLVRRIHAASGQALWQPESGSDATGFDINSVEPILTAISVLRTNRFVQYEGPFRAEFGLDPPALAIDVELIGGFGMHHLRLGKASSPDERYAAAGRTPSGTVFVVPGMLFKTWLPDEKKSELPKNVFAR